MRPVISAEVATVFMAMFFLIGGLFQLVVSVAVALPGWGWHGSDGLITFVLGLLVLAEWPASGLWVIGLFVGIDLNLLRRRVDRPGAWFARDVKGITIRQRSSSRREYRHDKMSRSISWLNQISVISQRQNMTR